MFENGTFFNQFRLIRRIQFAGIVKKRLSQLLVFLNLGLIGLATHAETVFYSNTLPAVFTNAPVYSVAGLYEWADDLPFTGSHRVSSFTFGYKTPGPVRGTFRFYGVDSASGKPGVLIAEIVRDLPGGANTTAIQLSESEQFNFTAEPGLNLTANTGGWFSVSYLPLNNTTTPGSILIRQARGDSTVGMYNVSTGVFVGTFDPGGLMPGSMYLQISEVSDAGSGGTVTTPVLKSVELTPSTVYAGAVANGTVLLSGPAPAQGVVVMLNSSKTSFAQVSVDELRIPQGSDRASFYVTTRDRIRKKKTVNIIAASNGVEVKTKLVVLP